MVSTNQALRMRLTPGALRVFLSITRVLMIFSPSRLSLQDQWPRPVGLLQLPVSGQAERNPLLPPQASVRRWAAARARQLGVLLRMRAALQRCLAAGAAWQRSV